MHMLIAMETFIKNTAGIFLVGSARVVKKLSL
jgi:hypothetical protein